MAPELNPLEMVQQGPRPNSARLFVVIATIILFVIGVGFFLMLFTR